MPPQPCSDTAVLKHMSHALWGSFIAKQQALQTLQPGKVVPQTDVPLSSPQLCGATHLQLPSHCAVVCVPFGSRMQLPVVLSQ